MKQQRRDHRRSCGQVLGFLRHYRPLSHGVPEQSAEAVCTDDCLKSLQDSKAVGRQGRERWQARDAAALLRRQDALHAAVAPFFPCQEHSLIKTIGDLAGWTTRHPPRS